MSGHLRRIGPGATDWAARYQRAGWAVLASVLLHGAVVTAWQLHSPAGRRAPPAPRAAMEVQWITAVPPAQAATAPSGGAKALVPARAPSAPGRTVARPQVRADPSVRAPEQNAAVAPPTRADFGTDRQDLAAAAPQQPASDSLAADAPVRWSADAVGRADRQERDWLRRHGHAPAVQWAADTGPAEQTALGAGLATREWRGGDGARAVQVQGPGGSSYCVRLPSANRLPELGAAPRVAPVSNCP